MSYVDTIDVHAEMEMIWFPVELSMEIIMDNKQLCKKMEFFSKFQSYHIFSGTHIRLYKGLQ